MKALRLKSWWPVIILVTIVGVFFWPFLAHGSIPLPADIILGAYHPFRDVVWEDRQAGFPVKNFTIFDPVRQLYPWRLVAIEEIKSGNWPLWNPYQFGGTPLLAQIFTAAFYPLNLIFFLFDFNFSWAFLVILQPLMVSLATFTYLRNLKLSRLAAVLGSVIFTYSSFLMMRLEWNIVGHTAVWLPLALFSVDKFASEKKRRWGYLLVFSLAMSILAGYLQATIYIYFLTIIYALFRRELKTNLLFLVAISIILAAVQILPLGEVISFSKRAVDPEAGARFFLPWQQLIMFIAPDFFGNPATGNYWGRENYTEFCPYVGILSLFLVFLTIFFKQSKEIKFWQLVVLLCSLLVTSNPLSRVLQQARLPLFSSLTPSRLILLIDFSLAVLAALGADGLIKERSQWRIKIFLARAIAILVRIYSLVLIVFFAGWLFWPLWQKNAGVSFRNLILPSGLLVANLFLISLFLSLRKKRFRQLVVGAMFLLLAFDLVRQAKKYNAFIEPELIFPPTETIKYLQSQKEPFRFQKADVELFPGNFQIAYGLEAIDGYDPFFSRRTARLFSAANSLGTDLFGQEFERDIFLGNHASPIFEALNTKYVLTLRDLDYESHLRLLMQEGETRLYENTRAGPRAFLVGQVLVEPDEKKALALMLQEDLHQKVILEKEVQLGSQVDETIKEETVLLNYPSANRAEIKVASFQEKVLVLADSYYPGWQVLVDDQRAEILRADYNLRGVVVPAGEHQVEFIYQPRSFKIGLYLTLGTLVFLLMGGVNLLFKTEQ